MKPQGHQIRSVIYDARARQFLADVSFLDIRGTLQRLRVSAPGTPNQDYSSIITALLGAALMMRPTSKGS